MTDIKSHFWSVWAPGGSKELSCSNMDMCYVKMLHSCHHTRWWFLLWSLVAFLCFLKCLPAVHPSCSVFKLCKVGDNGTSGLKTVPMFSLCPISCHPHPPPHPPSQSDLTSHTHTPCVTQCLNWSLLLLTRLFSGQVSTHANETTTLMYQLAVNTRSWLVVCMCVCLAAKPANNSARTHFSGLVCRPALRTHTHTHTQRC